MINIDMRLYDYYTLTNNDYAQSVIDETPKGKIKIAIYNTTQSAQDNILYKSAQYIGLTSDTEIDDKYIIQYEEERLKVLYIQKKGRFKQIFMERVS